MIAERLKTVLLQDLISKDYSGNQLHGTDARLSVLVDMAAQKPELRDELKRKFEGRLFPLVTHSQYRQVTPLSAHLIAPTSQTPEAYYHFIDELSPYNTDVICAWITSTFETLHLAEHFRQAAFAVDEQNRKYLLRYYDPFVTPVLYGNASDEWHRWFFAPIINWWYVCTQAENEQWQQLVGYRQKTALPSEQTPVPLILTKDLLQALENDPLPANILNQLEKSGTARFNTQCEGMRLAQVKEMLADAKKRGFTEHNHLCDYVWLGFHHHLTHITAHGNWSFVRKHALEGKGELLTLTRQYILS